jgi:translation initiation factor IF-1
VGADAAVTLKAKVMEEMPSLIFRVETETGGQVLAHAVGMTERNFVRLLPGDKVEIELAPADATRGRILKKL